MFAKVDTEKTTFFGTILDAAGAEYTSATADDIKISKNDGTPVAISGTLTHKEVGNYELVLSIEDMSDVGTSVVSLSKTTYIAPPVVITVLSAPVYDALMSGTDYLQVDQVQYKGSDVPDADEAGYPKVTVSGVVEAELTSASLQDVRNQIIRSVM